MIAYVMVKTNDLKKIAPLGRVVKIVEEKGA